MRKSHGLNLARNHLHTYRLAGKNRAHVCYKPIEEAGLRKSAYEVSDFTKI